MLERFLLILTEPFLVKPEGKKICNNCTMLWATLYLSRKCLVFYIALGLLFLFVQKLPLQVFRQPATQLMSYMVPGVLAGRAASNVRKPSGSAPGLQLHAIPSFMLAENACSPNIKMPIT